LRLIFALAVFGFASGSCAQLALLPDAPLPSATLLAAGGVAPRSEGASSSADPADPFAASLQATPAQAGESTADSGPSSQPPKVGANTPVDANGNPIPLNRQEPQRILGFMPNFRSVSGGAKPPPPGWKYNFIVATHQATDYSSFIFLGITSLTAEGMDAHPALGKGPAGFYAYAWRGFLDKTDGTYLSAWLLPSLLHEDTRYYALGAGHSIPVRTLYVISRQAVARTYGGRQTPNLAGLGGKVLTQVVQLQVASVALTSSLNPAGLGQPITFTATVSAAAPATGTPGGGRFRWCVFQPACATSTRLCCWMAVVSRIFSMVPAATASTSTVLPGWKSSSSSHCSGCSEIGYGLTGRFGGFGSRLAAS